MEPGLKPLVVSALSNEAFAVRRRGVLPLFVTGDGPILAHRLRAELERQRPSRVLAIGLAGALDPGLDAGQLLGVARVVDENGRLVGRLAPTSARCSPGVCASTRAIVPTPEAKQALWARIGRPEKAIVDIESKIYATICEELDVPLSILKVVSDGADEAIPTSVLDAVGRDGSVSQSGVAARALLAPWQIPSLARFGRRVARASTALADAVEAELRAEAPS